MIETRQIRIPVAYASFDDFYESNIVPIGPSGQLISALSPDALKRRQLMKSDIDADTENIIGEPSVRGDHIGW